MSRASLVLVVLMHNLGCDSKDAIEARVQEDNLRNEIAALIQERNTVIQERNTIRASKDKLESAIAEDAVRVQNLHDSYRDNLAGKIREITKLKSELRACMSTAETLKAELAKNVRPAETPPNTTRSTDSEPVWEWDPQSDYEGLLSIGNVPEGSTITIELIDPILGPKYFRVSSSISKNLPSLGGKKIILDPKKVEDYCMFRSKTSVQFLTEYFGRRGTFGLTEDWWRVTVSKP